MKKIGKILSALVVAVVILGLSGCGVKNEGGFTNPEAVYSCTDSSGTRLYVEFKGGEWMSRFETDIPSGWPKVKGTYEIKSGGLKTPGSIIDLTATWIVKGQSYNYTYTKPDGTEITETITDKSCPLYYTIKIIEKEGNTTFTSADEQLHSEDKTWGMGFSWNDYYLVK